MESKVLVDKQVLGGRGKDVLLLVFPVLGLIEGDVGKGFEVVGGSRGDRGTGDDVGRGIGGAEKGEVLDVVKSRPDELWQWGARRGSDRRWGVEGVGTGTWVVPSVEIGLEDLKDGGGSISDILLVNVVKG